MDPLGRVIEITDPPRRIVSLVPSHTETVFDLGAGDRVVGVTRYCVHPAAGVASLTKVGGTKAIDLEKIAPLGPDLVLAEQEENTREIVLSLEALWPVYVSRIRTVGEAVENIRKFGDLLGDPARGDELARQVDEGLNRVRGRVAASAAYLIWRKPYMAAGADTFIDSLLAHVGLRNVIRGPDSRYPALELDSLAALDPDVVLLSTEPFPFAEKHVTEVKKKLPRARVVLVDGEMFSWHGSRLRLFPNYMDNILPRLKEA